MPIRLPRLHRFMLPALAAAALFAPGASAEMPQNRDAPTITTAPAPVVGQTLLGNNGTWLYVDGSPCRGECQYSFAWQRCSGGGDCATIPGGLQRAYRVNPADVGRSLRVAVTATKYDCNAHGQDCRNVSRTAYSPLTAAVERPSETQLKLTRVAVERATRGRLIVSVRVVDERGRAATGSRVSVQSGRVAKTAVAQSSGVARVAFRFGRRTSAVGLSVRAERAGAAPATLDVRVPIAR